MLFRSAVRHLNEAITKAGGPANLITMVETPPLDTAQQLFTHPGIRLLLVPGDSFRRGARIQARSHFTDQEARRNIETLVWIGPRAAGLAGESEAVGFSSPEGTGLRSRFLRGRGNRSADDV